ncbi:AmmeMemoRadiSam system protein B [Treponema sp. J25]|uniref:AmmeMemoRadiSam system protein B n=1 Tax=Treponema sp. J25 TaxID=2094121 RepID=UPI00104FE4ED|nr:AmmeMemoRadiSam system protein B [Treponema sp. J25]TCW60075.1 AmmeMemoRadiSam system protein B [Treponema sp. J25]
MAKASAVKIRDMLLADFWYPQDEDIARRQIQGYEQEQSSLLVHSLPLQTPVAGQEKLPSGKVHLMVLPHAAWDLVGPLLSRAFLYTRSTPYQHIILIGPSHDSREEGIFVSESDIFTTPLGPVRVDTDGIEEFASTSTLVTTNDILHLSEYSLEPLLPFIAYYFPDTPIVPVLTGKIPHWKSILALQRALELVMAGTNGEVLIIISCNFSSSQKELKEGSFAPLFAALENHNEEALLTVVRSIPLEICGLPALLACLRLSFFSSLTMRVLGSLSVDGEEGGNFHYYHALVWEEPGT